MRLCRSVLLLLMVLLPTLLAAESQEDALTRYIVSIVRDYGTKTFKDSLAVPNPVLQKTSSIPRLEGDTLFVPEEYWGYKTTNDYRLHLCAGIILYQKAFEKTLAGDSGSHLFFKSSGLALELIIKYIKSQEKKDPILEPLLIRRFLLDPYAEALGRVVPSRDMNDSQLRFFSVLRCAIGYRCDTLYEDLWLNSSKRPSYGISGVIQKPGAIFGGKYEVSISLSNKGDAVCPVELMIDNSGKGDTLLKVGGFSNDTVITFQAESSILKVILDPAALHMESDLSDNQFVSDEFHRKRNVTAMVVMVIWNVLAAFVSFMVLMFAGFIIHRLSALYMNNHYVWTGIWFVIFLFVKLTLPFTLFGFNLWGFFHYMQYAYREIGQLWLICSAISAAFLTYYFSVKEGTSFIRYSAFFKWIMLFSFLEPLLSGIRFFISF
ncbi:MAG: hypothetical protein JNL74_07975 [Fibrobacteres bacterium]|nr:hypothetical protein [Fibrobacterota bacterium]